MKVETERLNLEERENVNLESGVVPVQSVYFGFTDLEQELWNSGQKIYRVLSFYDRFLFKFEDFT